jgi:uncharacterized membrane protein YgcG
MSPLPGPIRGFALPFVLMAALALAACGSGDSDKKLLSTSASARLTSTLDQVQRLVDEGDCQGAEAETSLLRQQAGALPSRVDVDLRNAVVSSANRLERLIADQCQAATTAPAPAQPQEEQPQENGNGKEKKAKKPKNEQGNGNDQGTSGPAGPGENQGGDSGTTGSGGSGDGTGGNGDTGF